MCGIAGYSLSPESTDRAHARGAGTARRDLGARRGRGRLRASHDGRLGGRDEAQGWRERSARRDLGSARDDPGTAPYPRLHKGCAGDRGEQPPDPARRGRGRAQRRHRERRSAARPVRDRARDPGDDGRLRGDLRADGAPRRATVVRSASSGGRWRRRGSTSDGPRASSWRVGSPAHSGSGARDTDLFFASTRRALAIVEAALKIRLDASRAEGRTAARGRLAARSCVPAASARTRAIGRRSSPPCTRRTRPFRASRTSRRSRPRPPSSL